MTAPSAPSAHAPPAPAEASPARPPAAPPPRPRRPFAERLAEDPSAAIALLVPRSGPGPLREPGGPAPVAGPRPVTPPPGLEALGVVSLRVGTRDGAGEVALRIRSGDGILEVRLREAPRSGVEITLSGSVPEADLERLGGLIVRRLGPDARVEIAPDRDRRPGDGDPRDHRGREEPEEPEVPPGRPRPRRGAGGSSR